MLYELPTFEHADAESVQEAVFWLEKWGNAARVIAGGTDLLGLMKDNKIRAYWEVATMVSSIEH